MDNNEQVGKYWMIFAGVSLIGAGLLGFVAGNPIAQPGSRSASSESTRHITSCTC